MTVALHTRLTDDEYHRKLAEAIRLISVVVIPVEESKRRRTADAHRERLKKINARHKKDKS